MNDYELTVGPHRRPGAGRCAMEWIAHMTGEPHSDAPSTVSPVLAAFARSRNDALDDRTRQRLRPYLARMIGTAGDGLDEWRAALCTDWVVVGCVPALLEHAGLADHADAPLTEAARAVAGTRRDRRRGSCSDGARHATRALTQAAGWEAARAAVRAAGVDTSSVDRACQAARDAAWVAAWLHEPSPWQAARPVADALQSSSFELLDRMLPGEPLTLARKALAAA
jgi:hypothetical protein